MADPSRQDSSDNPVFVDLNGRTSNQDEDVNSRTNDKTQYGSSVNSSGSSGFCSSGTTTPDVLGAQEPRDKPDPYSGRRIAERFLLDERIGRGGMSVVYRAHHVQLGKTVAIKLLLPHLVEELKSQQRFAREAKAASSLDHLNVMTVHDYGMTDEGEAYIVMDYLGGQSLSDILLAKKSISPEKACEIFFQTANGLQHAHNRGVIHRDLKPSNLMLVSSEGKMVVKIVDFGIAKLALDYETSGQNLTKTGEVFGSPYYMSPEQCKGKITDSRSDIYSMGTLMYEALVGKPPFVGENSLETMYLHLNENPPWITKHNSPDSLTKRLDEIIQKCLEKNPVDRYQSAADLAIDLDRARTAETIDWRGKALAAKTMRTRKLRGGPIWRVIQLAKVTGMVSCVGILICATVGCLNLLYLDGVDQPFKNRTSYRQKRLSIPELPPPPKVQYRRGNQTFSGVGYLEDAIASDDAQEKLRAWTDNARAFEDAGKWMPAAEAAEKGAQYAYFAAGRHSLKEARLLCSAGEDLYYASRQSAFPISDTLAVRANQDLRAGMKLFTDICQTLIHSSNETILDMSAAQYLVKPSYMREEVLEERQENNDSALHQFDQEADRLNIELMQLVARFPDAHIERQVYFSHADILRRTNLYPDGNPVKLRSALNAYHAAIQLWKGDMKPDDLVVGKEHYGLALTLWELSLHYDQGEEQKRDRNSALNEMSEALALVRRVSPPDKTLIGSMMLDYRDMLWQDGQWWAAATQTFGAWDTLRNKH